MGCYVNSRHLARDDGVLFDSMVLKIDFDPSLSRFDAFDHHTEQLTLHANVL